MMSRAPDFRRTCPECSHTRSSPANRAEKVLVVWNEPGGGERSYCHHCAETRVLRGGSGKRHQRTQPPRTDNSAVADYLWRTSLSAENTHVEPYLHEARKIGARLQATTRYLSAHQGHAHAMICPFGLVEEIEPSILALPQSVTAVHLTRLSPDGLKIFHKRMIGPVSGQPIVLAPPNDGLGLVITEGIEDALSMHAATGLGAWAAGSAGHMATLALAVPWYIEHVLILADNDPPGLKGAFALETGLLARGFDVTVKTVPDFG